MDKHTLKELMPLIKKVAEAHVLSEAVLSDYVKHVISLKPSLTEEEVIKRIKNNFQENTDNFVKKLCDELYPPACQN